MLVAPRHSGRGGDATVEGSQECYLASRRIARDKQRLEEVFITPNHMAKPSRSEKSLEY
jgi:hypothetical protein